MTSLANMNKSNFWLAPQTCAGSMIQTYSRNGTLKHWCGAATRMSWLAFRERLNIFFAKFFKNFHTFSCFFQFFCTKKCWKSIFRPVLAVCSTQTLVEIHSREREGVRRCLRRIPQGAITLKCEVRQGSGFKILVIAWEKNSGCVSHLCYYFFTLALLLSHFPPMFFLLIFPTVMALIFPGLLSERGGKKLRVEVEKNWKFKKKEKMKVRWRVKKF